MNSSKGEVSVRTVPCSVLAIELTTYKIISADEEFLRLVELDDVQTILGKKLKDCACIGNSVFKQWKEYCFTTVLKKGFAFIESTIYTMSGVNIPVFLCCTAFFGADGKLCGRILISRAAAVGTVNSDGTPQNGQIYQSMLDRLDEAAYIITKEGMRILYMNPQMERLFPTVRLGHVCHEEMNHLDRPCSACLIPKMRDENAFKDGHVFYDKKRGYSLDMEMAYINWNGEDAYLVVYSRIKPSAGEEKRRNQKQRVQERYANVFFYGHDIITQIDIATGAFQMISNQERYPFASVPEGNDYYAEEKQLLDFAVYPEDRQLVKETLGFDNMIAAFNAGETVREAVFRMYEAGNMVWKEIRAFHYDDADGEFIILTTKDVTGRETIKRKREEEHRRLADAVSRQYKVVFSVNLTCDEYNLLHNSGEMTEVFNGAIYPYYSDCIEKMQEKVHPADKVKFLNTCGRAELLSAIEDGITGRGCECRFVDDKGACTYMDIQTSLLQKEEDDHIRVMVMVRDQSQNMEKRKHLETMLEEMEGVATVKNQLLGRLSQEIKECGEKIFDVTAKMQEHCGDNGALVDGVKKIDSQTRHLTNMANNVRDISDMENDKVSVDEAPFCLQTFIDEICANMEIMAKRQHVTFQVVQKGEINGEYMGDEIHIRQILMQLLESAVKHSVSGGHVTFYIKKLKEEEEQEQFRFVIEDEGVGIEDELLERIFYAPEKTGREGIALAGGVGFGLIIVKRLVDMLGGEIEVRSLRGKGTIFQIVLTLSRIREEEKRPETLRNLERQAELFAGKRILVADDNALNQDMVVTLLGMRNVECVTANHGAEVIRKFTKSAENEFTMILLDTEMPIQDGFQAAQAIRSMDRSDAKTIPIIAMLENVSQEIILQVRECGIDSYIMKPVESIELFELMENMLI